MSFVRKVVTMVCVQAVFLSWAFAADQPEINLQAGQNRLVRATTIPDGFAGVPWGASKVQIVKIMNGRGYRQIAGDQPDELHFRGEFAGVSCQLNFDLIVDSFHTGEAAGCARSPSPDGPQATFKRIIDMLSKEYGEPHKRRSESIRNSSGKVLPWVWAEWNLSKAETSDKYSIYVIYSAASSADTKVDQYAVSVIYSADTLKRRLIDRIKPIPGPVID
ncbi:MAG: hypothetical protein ABFD50_08800 [Smithella sp.]